MSLFDNTQMFFIVGALINFLFLQTFVGMHNDLIQRQDKYFKEADKFVPERWLRGESQEQVHPFASLPFGFGSRSCIGKRFAEQEVSLALIKVISKLQYLC